MNPNIPNPFFQKVDPTESSIPVSQEDVGSVVKVRYVTLSPAEEFEQREGETESLHPAFQAMLCDARKGRCRVTEKGVTLSRGALVGKGATGEKRTFYHPDSPLCHDLGRSGDLVCFYVYNPANPDLIHLLDKDSGSYLGSLPAENRPGFLDREAMQQEYEDHLRVQRRYTDRLQSLSEERSLDALDRARQNTESLQRACNTLDLREDLRPATPADAPQVPREISAATARIERGQSDFEEIAQQRDRLLSRPRRVSRDETETEATPTYDPYNK